MSQRKTILTGIHAFLQARHDVSTGTETQTFRKGFITPWKPGEDMRPSYHLSDTGTRKKPGDSSETCKTYITTVEIVLNLKDDWRREANYQGVVDLVEDIILNLENRCSIAPGVQRVHFTTDSPFEVVLQSGASESIWTIEFEVEWFGEVPDLTQ